MNNRWGNPPYPETLSPAHMADSDTAADAIDAHSGTIMPGTFLTPARDVWNTSVKPNGKKDQLLLKDALFILKRDDCHHVISENYHYKTESYYTILRHELEGRNVLPSSSAVLDACVVPICLERAKLAGIPVCEWGISQAYVPLPAILYGLNYFATTSDFFVVSDNDKAKEAIKHISNKGKYPFCYQKLAEGATILLVNVIFGRTTNSSTTVASCAKKIYELFSIPLLQMVFVKTGEHYALSSLSSTRYSHLMESERSLLCAYLSHKEFL